jgi:hypothetical protein
MGWNNACNKKRITNIEQGMSNAEAIWQREENFIIRNSMFDIRYSFRAMASSLFSNYQPQKHWLNSYNCPWGSISILYSKQIGIFERVDLDVNADVVVDVLVGVDGLYS